MTAAAASVQAQAITAGPGVVNVQCSINALVTAINTANSGGPGTLLLAGNCTYGITIPATASDGLPLIAGHIGLVGGPNTVIRRSPAAFTAFRVLDVAAGASLRVSNLSIRNGKTAGLGDGIQNAGSLWVSKVTFSGNNAGNGGALSNNSGAGLNTQTAGISHIIQSQLVRNVSGGLGGGISNLGTTTLYGTSVRFNRGSAGGGIATSNTNVTLQKSAVTDNTPDNCSPLGAIPGCAG
jgi:hypothetical protein